MPVLKEEDLDHPKTLSLDRVTTRRPSSVAASESDSTEHCLDVFVYGDENMAVADLFGAAQVRNLANWSPVYLFGPHLCGKTSLAVSLSARWGRAVGQKSIVHIDGGDFARSLVAAIESDDMDRFRKRHRQSALLVIDGLQGLASKPAAQEELIATLDERSRDELPTIITALTLPNAVRNLKTGLVSRCLGGLSIAVAYPGPEARSKVLSLLSRKLNLHFRDGELESLAKRFTDPVSVPELQGLLLKWWHQTNVDRLTPVANESNSLSEMIDARLQAKIPDVSEIAKRVAKESNLKLADLRGATRRSQIVRARSLAMLLARELTPLSYQQIGEYFGKRDHTTVMHACRKLESDLMQDRELQRIADEVKRQLR